MGQQFHDTVEELSTIEAFTLKWLILPQEEKIPTNQTNKQNINKASPEWAGRMLSRAPNLPGNHGVLLIQEC